MSIDEKFDGKYCLPIGWNVLWWKELKFRVSCNRILDLPVFKLASNCIIVFFQHHIYDLIQQAKEVLVKKHLQGKTDIV